MSIETILYCSIDQDKINAALSEVKAAYNSVAYKEQLEYVYTTNKKVADRNAIIDRVYNDILLGIDEVEEASGCMITVPKSALYLTKKNDSICIDFVNDDSAYELFLNTEAMSEYKISIFETDEDNVTITILL